MSDDKQEPLPKAVSKLPATAKELIAIHTSLADNELLWAIKRLPELEKDQLVPCPARGCGAGEGEPCKIVLRRDRRAGVVTHFGRRVRRLLKGIR